jgi:penicillin-binding protein 1A
MRLVKYFIFVMCLGFFALLIYGGYLFFSLPNIKSIEDYKPPLATIVYADDGQILGEFFHEKRYFVPLDQISPYLIKAFIAAEDERFYEHKGFDWLGMIRALMVDIKAMAIVEGASTITQQTVKALLLSPERSFSRKAREVMLAYLLERRLSKEEILTIYLNQVYFGHGAYGVEAASRVFFGKHASELNLAEAAMLAGLPKGPAYYSPYNHFLKAKKRQQYVLKRMVSCSYLCLEDAEEASKIPLELDKLEYKWNFTAYFLEYVRQYLIENYGYDLTYNGGLSVYTSANIMMHSLAQKALLRGLNEIKARHPDKKDSDKIEGALLSIETKTGLVKVMLGGKDFETSEFNRATQACRQPGSAFKPIIYAAALDKGYTTASVMYDYPIIYTQRESNETKDLKVWRPHNYSGRFYGQTSLRDALVYSRNAVTIRLLKGLDVNYVINYARRLGITSYLTPDLSLGLGSSCMSLLELTMAFSVFANQGQYIEPITIKKILDRNGNVLEDNLPLVQPTIDAETAYLITNILEDVVKRGTGRRARSFSRPVAGKTGSTNDYTDAWFIGYTPYYVTGVWVGYDGLKSLGRHETGGRTSAPIWLYFMQEIEKDLPPKPFTVPAGVVFVKINPKTGTIADPADPTAKMECFKKTSLSSKRVLSERKDHLVDTLYKDGDF